MKKVRIRRNAYLSLSDPLRSCFTTRFLVQKVMERDCLLGQGAASFEKDRLIGCSDEFRMWICDICGVQAHTENKGEIRECKICGLNKCSNIKISYGTKLVNQELNPCNIIPRILTHPHDPKIASLIVDE